VRFFQQIDPAAPRPGRRRARRWAAVTAVAVGALGGSALPAAAVLQPNRVRVLARGTDSVGGQMPSGAAYVELSADGRWMTWSNANAGYATYRKDLLSGATIPVSLNDADVASNGPSQVMGISLDGNKVLFLSLNSSNIGGGTPTMRDLFLRDVAAKTTTRVNVVPGGAFAAVLGFDAVITDDGKTVVFTTSAGVTYARNLVTSVSERVDVSSAEVAGSGLSTQPVASATGRYVAFSSDSVNLVAGDSNKSYDVFVRDRQAGTTQRVSIGDDGQLDAGSYQPGISADGRYVAFMSLATNAVGGDTNKVGDVFRRDRTNLTTYRASVTSGGAQATMTSFEPEVSNDGRYVAFASQSPNLASSTMGGNNVIRRDLDQGITTQFGLNKANQGGNGGSAQVSMSTDGQSLAFVSSASNLVPSDTNNLPDAFVDHEVTLGPFVGPVPFSDRQVADFSAPAASKGAHAADLVDGRTSPEHLIVSLAHAPGWAVDRPPVARLYQAFFHREPDLGGLNFWVKKHAAGTKLSKIASTFAGSSEFETAYGNVDDTAFVKLVYGNVLQRKPDAAGLAHWVAKLGAGMSRGDLMVAFSESSEGGRVLAPEVDSALIGLAMLGAMPPKALYDAAAAAHRATGVAEGGAAVYVSSVPYAQRVAGL
jgi:Tol biopolymer transport system component